MMTQEEGMIIFNHVSFKYNSDEPLALNDVSFRIPKGKWTSIVGHNGSGCLLYTSPSPRD